METGYAVEDVIGFDKGITMPDPSGSGRHLIARVVDASAAARLVELANAAIA